MIEPIVVADQPTRYLSIRCALDHVVLSEFRHGAGEALDGGLREPAVLEEIASRYDMRLV